MAIGAKSLAINSGGDAAVAWFTRPGGLVVALRPGRTGAWRDPEQVIPEAGSSAIGIQESGAMVLLAAPEFARVLAFERPAGAAGFGSSTALTAPGELVFAPSLSMRPDGAAVAWWLSGFAVRPAGGPFGPTRPLPEPHVASSVSTTLALGPTGEVLALRTGAGNGLETAAAPTGSPLPALERQVEGLFGAQAVFEPDGDALVVTTGLDEPSRGRTNVPIALLGQRSADGAWGPFRRVSPPGLRSNGPSIGANSSGAAVVSWTLRRPRQDDVAQAILREGAGRSFSVPETLPAALGPDARPGIEEDGDVWAITLRDGVVRVAERMRNAPRAPALSAAQLRINQRISQAAVRRANAIVERLRQGLSGADLRPGALGAATFRSEVSVAGSETSAFLAPGARRPLIVPPAEPGGAGTVRLSAGQLRINQRIAQRAVVQANLLAELIGGGLTGDHIADGTIGAAHLAPGLSIASVGPAPPPGPPPMLAVRLPGRSGDRVTLTAAQLRINQRISQAALRRLDAVADQLERGLSGVNFRPGSITGADLASELRE